MAWGNGAPRGWPEDVPANNVTGTGTPNILAMWTAAHVLGDSLVGQSGGNVVIQGTAALYCPTSVLINTQKYKPWTPLQLQSSVTDLVFQVDAGGDDWQINCNNASGGLTVDGNKELKLNALNGGDVQLQINSGVIMGNVHLFPNSIAMAIPPALKISGRNSTDTGQRTAVIRISPTFNDCLEFDGVGRFNFTDDVQVIRGAANNFAFNTIVTGDTNDRLLIQADGKMQWGTGAAALDTTLERSAAGQLKISNYLIVSKNLSLGKTTFEIFGNGTAYNALQIGGNACILAETAEAAGKQLLLSQNAYLDNVTWKYISTDEATLLSCTNGMYVFRTSLSGAADTNIVWIAALKINETGNSYFYKQLAIGSENYTLAQLHVDQNSVTAAIASLYLNQDDLSEEMIHFNTTVGIGHPIENKGAKTLTVTEYIKITTPNGTRYLQAGTIL